jgi:hypothetical protein
MSMPDDRPPLKGRDDGKIPLARILSLAPIVYRGMKAPIAITKPVG